MVRVSKGVIVVLILLDTCSIDAASIGFFEELLVSAA